MSKIRIEQRKDESPDLMVMRLFAKIVPLVERHHAFAAINWMRAVAADHKVTFQCPPEVKP